MYFLHLLSKKTPQEKKMIKKQNEQREGMFKNKELKKGINIINYI